MSGVKTKSKSTSVGKFLRKNIDVPDTKIVARALAGEHRTLGAGMTDTTQRGFDMPWLYQFI